MIRKTFVALLIALVFLEPAYAFSLKKSSRRNSSAILSETSQYRIVFAYESRIRHDAEDSKIKWVELSYKYADLEAPPAQRLMESGGGRIRFLDEDGFALASDVIRYADLESGDGDHYGFIWVEKKRAKKIVKADIVPLRPEEKLLLAPVEAAPSPSPTPAPVPEPTPPETPSPESTPSPEPSAVPEPVEEEIPVYNLPSPEPTPSVVVEESPSPSPTPPPPPLERGGASNEELEATLKDQQAGAPTFIPPSETKVDLPESTPTILDDTAAPPPPPPQEEEKNGVIIKQDFL